MSARSRPPAAQRPSGARRSPPASSEAHRAVLRLARNLADELDPRKSAAVLLAGSWARGDAHEASDIDLWVIVPRVRRAGYPIDAGRR